MKTLLRCFLWINLLLAATGCASSFEREAAAAEQKWQQQNIVSYQVKVQVVESIWHLQTYTITVREGQVVSSSTECSPAPAESGKCTVKEFDASDYTIPGLFSTADEQAKSKPSRYVQISYDLTYGFPNHIAYDDPQIYDEDFSLSVKEFNVLQ